MGDRRSLQKKLVNEKLPEAPKQRYVEQGSLIVNPKLFSLLGCKTTQYPQTHCKICPMLFNAYMSDLGEISVCILHTDWCLVEGREKLQDVGMVR